MNKAFVLGWVVLFAVAMSLMGHYFYRSARHVDPESGADGPNKHGIDQKVRTGKNVEIDPLGPVQPEEKPVTPSSHQVMLSALPDTLMGLPRVLKNSAHNYVPPHRPGASSEYKKGDRRIAVTVQDYFDEEPAWVKGLSRSEGETFLVNGSPARWMPKGGAPFETLFTYAKGRYELKIFAWSYSKADILNMAGAIRMEAAKPH